MTNEERLENICDKIFLKDLAGELCQPFYQKWIKSLANNWNKTISYTSRIKGVDVKVDVYLEKGRGVASLSIGEYRRDNCHYQKITFSLFKKAYLNEFINRLGIANMLTIVDNIIDNREKQNSKAEELCLKKDIFKRYLPFIDISHNDGYLVAHYNNYHFDIENLEFNEPRLIIRGNVDFLMKITAYAKQLIDGIE